MTDYTKDTPSLGKAWCPGCDPEWDPRFEILDVRWCGTHAIDYTGLADADVPQGDSYPMGGNESEGLNNAAFQRLIS